MRGAISWRDPVHGENWRRIEGIAPPDYIELIDLAVTRTSPQCLTNRRYSVDLSRWYYLMLWRLSLLCHCVPINSSLIYWQGADSDDAEGLPGNVAPGSSTVKMKSTIDFARGAGFGSHLVLGAITSIPRWEHARALESSIADEGAVGCIAKSTASIMRGGISSPKISSLVSRIRPNSGLGVENLSSAYCFTWFGTARCINPMLGKC